MPHIHERYDFVVSVFIRALGLIFFGLFCFRLAAASEIEFAKVSEVTGDAKIFKVGLKQWRPLEKNTLLNRWDQLRTGPQSCVQIVFDADLQSVAQLGENSTLVMLKNAPREMRLERGEFFIFREEAQEATPVHASGPSFRIWVQNIRMDMVLAGCAVTASSKGVRLRVFADEVALANLGARGFHLGSGAVKEGFQWVLDRGNSRTDFRRMTYADYEDWQLWIKKVYEIKDDAEADAVEKEFGL